MSGFVATKPFLGGQDQDVSEPKISENARFLPLFAPTPQLAIK
jgi:hypothetical protein